MHWRLQRMVDRQRRLAHDLRNAAWRFRSRDFPRDPNGLIRLHIGCGEIAAPGFVNIDARRYPHVHLVTKDLFRLHAVPDGQASLVYMCHVLEHVPYAQLDQVLREMRRVLAPGGKLRLSVPDFELVLSIYEQSARNPDAIVGPLMGGQDYAFNFHYNVFSEANLMPALRRTGFAEVGKWDPADCENHDFSDWADRPVSIGGRSFQISLNLEAMKPGASA